MNSKNLVYASILGSFLTCGCVKMYELPDAPPKAEWEAAAEPEEQPEDVMRRFLDAKRAAIQCFAALADGNWEKAMQWMSAETLALFAEYSNGEGAQAVFENGSLWINGEEVAFDPVGDVFIHELNDIRDDFAGRQDDESKTRKVLYAVSASGMAREIVFIFEDGRWVLQKTDVSFDLLTE